MNYGDAPTRGDDAAADAANRLADENKRLKAELTKARETIETITLQWHLTKRKLDALERGTENSE